MDLLVYLGKKVHLKLTNGFFYVGEVVDATKSDITLIDRKGNRVSVSRDFILSIEEVNDGSE